MGTERMSGNMTTILSCVAALVSATTAIYAIKQSILQRRLSYKPQLYIDDYFHAHYAPNSNIFDCDINAKANIEFHSLSLINIGNGAAQNINYEWKYNYSNALSDISYLIKQLENKNSQSNGGKNNSFFYEVEKDKNAQYIFINNKKHSATFNFNEKYILPQHQAENNNKTKIIHLPIILTTILYNLVNLKTLSGEKITSFIGPKLILTYQDSGGTLITDHFESEFTLGANEKSARQTKQYVRIKFKKLDSRWTR